MVGVTNEAERHWYVNRIDTENVSPWHKSPLPIKEEMHNSLKLTGKMVILMVLASVSDDSPFTL